MKSHLGVFLASVLALPAGLAFGSRALAQTDPLPSWNEGPAKQAIMEFVQRATDKSSPEFVPPDALEAHHRLGPLAPESRDDT